MSTALGGVAGVDVASFEWSGKNSGVARHKAAVELAKVLDDSGRGYSAVGMVGHSHGGNVMRLAASLTQNCKINHLIFLGTPFINAETRNVAGLMRAAMASLLLSLALIAWNVFAAAIAEAGILIDASVLDFQILVLLAAVSLGAVFVTLVVERQSKRAQVLFPDMMARTRRADHVFQVTGDEAGRLLRSMSYLPNAGYQVLQFLSNVAIVVGKHWATPLWLIPVGIVMMLQDQRLQSLSFPIGAFSLLLLSATMSLLILLAFGAAWLVFSAVMRFTPWAFGYEGFASLLSMNLRVREAPARAEADSSSYYRVRFPATAGFVLRHSRFYNDARIIAMIRAIAAEQVPELPKGVAIAEAIELRPSTEPKKWSPFALVGLVFGVLCYPLVTALANPLLATLTQEEIGFECEAGHCTEVDPAVVDKPFENGCTVQADDSCTLEEPQEPPPESQ